MGTGQRRPSGIAGEHDEVLALDPTPSGWFITQCPGCWLVLGPDLRPSRALLKLQRLFDRHTFWARGRSFKQLQHLLAGSDAVVARREQAPVGFGQPPPMVAAEPCSGTSSWRRSPGSMASVGG